MFKPDSILRCGDCLEIMPHLPAQSINLILTDLPYGTTQNKWDALIPFEPMWREFWRICRGPVVLTAAQPFSSALVMSARDNFRYEWIWEKPKATGFLNCKKEPLRAHESVLVFGRGEYLPQMTEGERYTPKGGKSKRDSYGEFQNIRENDGALRYPRTVQIFSADAGQHPTQKPVALMEYMIRTYTRPGAWVLDATMGSGTTGVAAMRTSRNFVGIEKDPDYFRIACARIGGA